MKCIYCNTELGKPYYHGAPYPVSLRCNDSSGGKCPTEVEYRFGASAQVYRISFYCNHNDKLYNVSIDAEEVFVFNIFHIKGNLAYPVVRTKSVPNITPFNVKEKLPLYLALS